MNIASKIGLESIHFMQNNQLHENPLAKKILNIALPILAVLFALWAFRDNISNYFQVKQIKSNRNANPLVQQVNQVMIKDFSDQIHKDIFSTINIQAPQKRVPHWFIDDIQSAKLFLSLDVPSTQASMNVETVMKRANGQCFDRLFFRDKLTSIFEEKVQSAMSDCLQSTSDLSNCKFNWRIIMKLKNDDFHECTNSYSFDSPNSLKLECKNKSKKSYKIDKFSLLNATLSQPIVDSQMEFI